jgi:hypothetical protein
LPMKYWSYSLHPFSASIRLNSCSLWVEILILMAGCNAFHPVTSQQRVVMCVIQGASVESGVSDFKIRPYKYFSWPKSL